MKKFDSFNKLTGKKEPWLSCNGVLKTITADAIPNKGTNGKSYFQFTAVVETPSGDKQIGGQLYEGLVPFLGGMPSVDDKLEFATKIADLQEQHNGRWKIGGASLDSVDTLLQDLDSL